MSEDPAEYQTKVSREQVSWQGREHILESLKSVPVSELLSLLGCRLSMARNASQPSSVLVLSFTPQDDGTDPEIAISVASTDPQETENLTQIGVFLRDRLIEAQQKKP